MSSDDVLNPVIRQGWVNCGRNGKTKVLSDEYKKANPPGKTGAVPKRVFKSPIKVKKNED